LFVKLKKKGCLEWAAFFFGAKELFFLYLTFAGKGRDKEVLALFLDPM